MNLWKGALIWEVWDMRKKQRVGRVFKRGVNARRRAISLGQKRYCTRVVNIWRLP